MVAVWEDGSDVCNGVHTDEVSCKSQVDHPRATPRRTLPVSSQRCSTAQQEETINMTTGRSERVRQKKTW